MATCEQLAVVLDSARGWTAVPMTLTGCYDTNHLFYALHSVYSVYTPGRHRTTITYIHTHECLYPTRTSSSPQWLQEVGMTQTMLASEK